MWKKLKSRVILPRNDNGHDWSVDRYLLASANGRRLTWWPGCMAWGGVGMPPYYRPGELLVIDTSQKRVGKEVFEGGRCSKARLADPKVRKTIADLLEVPENDLPVLSMKDTWEQKEW